jgi:hypothetical protein
MNTKTAIISILYVLGLSAPASASAVVYFDTADPLVRPGQTISISIFSTVETDSIRMGRISDADFGIASNLYVNPDYPEGSGFNIGNIINSGGVLIEGVRAGIGLPQFSAATGVLYSFDYLVPQASPGHTITIFADPSALNQVWVDIDGLEPVTPDTLTLTIVAEPTTLFVPAQYPTIQAAIDAAFNGDTVIVADGTYTGPGNRDIGFLGKAITVRSQSGPENCVIDCNGTEDERHRGFHFHNGEGSDSIVAGMTITNGVGPEEKFSYRRHSWMDSVGGAIFCDNSSPTVTNCVITDNYAYDDGGGIYCRDSSPTIFNCIIEDNTADSSGAGIYGCDGTIANCIIRYNVGYVYPLPDASVGGGLAYCDGNIVNCTITGNSTEIGGGLASCNGSIINSIIAGNFSELKSGGLYRCNGSIINCTIVNNKTDGDGGGVYRSQGSITNCIVWGNIADEYPQLYSTIPSYSCVQDWTGGGLGNIDADPCFTEPGYWDAGAWVEGDYRLLGGSLCIDAGDPNYLPEPNETDLDGNPRVINGRIDMGAYEYWPPVQAEMKLTPHTLNLVSKGNSITCRIRLPEDYHVGDVEPDRFMLEEEIAAEKVQLEGADAIVKFSRSALQEMLGDLETPVEVELLVTGQLCDGTFFEGTDTIRVIEERGGKAPK